MNGTEFQGAQPRVVGKKQKYNTRQSDEPEGTAT
jgi:hypothetical protein